MLNVLRLFVDGEGDPNTSLKKLSMSFDTSLAEPVEDTRSVFGEVSINEVLGEYKASSAIAGRLVLEMFLVDELSCNQSRKSCPSSTDCVVRLNFPVVSASPAGLVKVVGVSRKAKKSSSVSIAG